MNTYARVSPWYLIRMKYLMGSIEMDSILLPFQGELIELIRIFEGQIDQ